MIEEILEIKWVEADQHGIFYTLKDIFDIIEKRMKMHPETQTRVMIGTDSHGIQNMFHFVTVLGVWNVGKGGTYFHFSRFEPKKQYHGVEKLRLQNEVNKSLEIAFAIEEKFKIKPEIHIDISTEEKENFSSSMCELLKGYVLSSGYQPILKPDGFIASAIADKHTRKKIKKIKLGLGDKKNGQKTT
jgi:uncharacterized protein